MWSRTTDDWSSNSGDKLWPGKSEASTPASSRMVVARSVWQVSDSVAVPAVVSPGADRYSGIRMVSS